jgi:3-hydroxyisobutyrate dehydrogenase-like beta-hydroxyacid dehydrogenase
MPIRIALIGFGEVGEIFAEDFLRGGESLISAYDIIFERPEGSRKLQRAQQLGVKAAMSKKDAVQDARVIISAVTAVVSGEVARETAANLSENQLFLDVNSASPATKIASAGDIAEAGARFVEGAVMESVPGPRLRVPILGGGPHAKEAADMLNPLGMNIRPVAGAVGRASAIKLSRSIMIKGIEALIMHCTASAAHWEAEDEVFGSLWETFPSIDWAQLSRSMAGRVKKHGVRRSEEMRQAAEMLVSLGIDPALCLAVADAQYAGALKK